MLNVVSTFTTRTSWKHSGKMCGAAFPLSTVLDSLYSARITHRHTHLHRCKWLPYISKWTWNVLLWFSTTKRALCHQQQEGQQGQQKRRRQQKKVDVTTICMLCETDFVYIGVSPHVRKRVCVRVHKTHMFALLINNKYFIMFSFFVVCWCSRRPRRPCSCCYLNSNSRHRLLLLPLACNILDFPPKGPQRWGFG